MNTWNKKDTEYLQSHYPWEDAQEMSTILGRSWKVIRQKAAKLRVRRRVRHSVSKWMPNREIAREDLAYIAGFLDADGCITAHLSHVGGTHYVNPTIDISNTNKDVLDWICKTVGQPIENSLSVKKRKYITHRDYWTLRIRGRRQMVILLRQLLPFLKVKRSQAQLLLEYVSSDLASHSLEALKYARDIRIAVGSLRKQNRSYLEKLEEIITELESHTRT